jgi:Peptidase MA superfamily/Tetratricopeptide repeat/TPR repeat
VRIFNTIALALSLAVAGQQRSPAQLSKAGWDALNAGRIEEAASAFDEALRSGPQSASTLLGAGLAARLQGRTDDVRRFLVDALKIDPSLTPASLLLGNVLYQSGDLDGAIDVYQRAAALSPNNQQLSRQLETWRKEAALHSGFRQTLGDHFTVLFEGPAEADLATRAVTLLEADYWRIGTALSIYPTSVTTVILYTREQFRDITRSPEWAGGAFDGRIRIPVQGALQNSAEFERVLAHEFTHALIQSVAARGVPTWLHEGLADCFDGSDIRKKEEQVRQSETRVPLTRLEESFEGLTAKDASLAYAESAVAVRTLLDDVGPPALVSLLSDLGRGIPFAEAFERNILISYAEFQKKQTEF